MTNLIDIIDAQNEQAAQPYEDFIDELDDQRINGFISHTGHRVGTLVAPHFDWFRINADGAPLYLPHRVLLEGLPFKRNTLYVGHRELEGLGFIKTVGKTWHAAVGDLYV